MYHSISPHSLKCYAACKADEYDILGIKKFFKSSDKKFASLEGTIYFSTKEQDSQELVEVFIFYFGSIVIWGASEKKCNEILDNISAFTQGKTQNPSANSEVIECKYIPGVAKGYFNDKKDHLVIPSDNIFTKFSISYAVAQSVKLSFLENSVAKLIKSTHQIQKELSYKGSTSLSKREISKKTGMLFRERYSINLHNDMLDIPEFFWSRPIYEQLYILTAKSQDIQPRQNILNRRLDMMHDLYEMLSNDLSHKHSSRLEMTIIVLIGVEILLNLIHIAVVSM
ncbi:RMD1 family protein [Candidatus Sneabacter namystus]|uniref:RMD1 family protein n=1 Tax=Candidatus Sneabacter namystus TaxID=2601646 RepID=A0A5C0UJD5_9RICK|nr:RMD1 family protein [Candidatus Sneabacter namystus]QEK39711.1 RMD1 family protein [Candidatus Sneabacter namystus]